MAFLPQFIDVSGAFPIWLQFVVLGTIVNLMFSTVDVLCVVLAGAVIARLRRSSRAQRLMQRAGGAVLVGLGHWLLEKLTHFHRLGSQFRRSHKKRPPRIAPKRPLADRLGLHFDVAGLGESRADLEAEIVEVGLLAGRDRLAAGLTLGLFGAAGDVDRSPSPRPRGEATTGTVCRPRVLIGALSTIWLRSTEKPFGGDRLGEVAGRNRTVEHAGLAGLADEDEALAVELLADGLGFLAALEVAGLELGALRLEVLLVGLGGAQRLAAGRRKLRA